MSEEDKKLQKDLVDEMMKVYETNPNVMLYMQALMECYEKLEVENKQLKQDLKDACLVIEKIKKEKEKAIDKIKKGIFVIPKDTNELLEILGDKE